MFMKNGKKKAHPLLAIGVGAMALYGAYSAVCGAKQMCTEKAEMLTKAFKKKEKENKNDKKNETEEESDI